MFAAFSVAGVLADHIFNPLLTGNGRFSDTVGRIIGTGAERGSRLMVIISGFFLLLYSLFTAKGGRNPKVKIGLLP